MDTDKNLRTLLTEEDIGKVDAFLRRGNAFISTAEHLDVRERQEAMQGLQALKKLFYTESQQ